MGPYALRYITAIHCIQSKCIMLTNIHWYLIPASFYEFLVEFLVNTVKVIGTQHDPQLRLLGPSTIMENTVPCIHRCTLPAVNIWCHTGLKCLYIDNIIIKIVKAFFRRRVKLNVDSGTHSTTHLSEHHNIFLQQTTLHRQRQTPLSQYTPQMKRSSRYRQVLHVRLFVVCPIPRCMMDWTWFLWKTCDVRSERRKFGMFPISDVGICNRQSVDAERRPTDRPNGTALGAGEFTYFALFVM